MKTIQKKKYIKVDFTLTSPLSLGSGENNVTDRDIIKNSDKRQTPYIPASSIAGVIRNKISDRNVDLDKYFGNVKINKGEEIEEPEEIESRLVFYDAYIVGDYYISIRDSVALDDYKNAKNGAKFDMECLEPGAKFVTYIEQNFMSNDDDDIAETIAKCFDNGLYFGGKTSRGYGDIRVDALFFKEFELNKQVDEWLDFDLFNYDKWETINFDENKINKRIIISLKQEGGISIRKYTTKPSKDNEAAQPDMEQLTAHGERSIEPVIPGTSWAGAFRHRLKEFGIDVNGIDSIFGIVKEDKENKDKAIKKKSKIQFSESRIKDACEKVLSRNAIDRFSGGTVDGALFTEKTYYGGTTDLVISLTGREGIPEKEQLALSAAITDLHYGLLAVGGETSIGRGIFSIEKINDTEIDEGITPNALFNIVAAKVKEMLG